MRSLEVPSAKPNRFRHRFVCTRLCVAGMALLAATGLVGCDAASGPAMPTMPSGIVIPKTPEEKLDRVMERMRSALEDAQAASGPGVISERTCDYRLIPPASDGGQYTAEVTIKTKLSLAKAPAAATLPLPEEEEGAKAEEEAADFEGEGEEGEEPRPDNGVTRKAVAQSRDFRTDVYQLAYEGDRWKLLTKPKGETDQLILEFALGQ
jgi:hypothetical protein